jgi:SAM-dependent methyltransferase
MATPNYRYPDTDDHITVSFIGSREPYPGYWEASEQRALVLAAEHLGTAFGPRTRTRALDVGCGSGRLLPWIAAFAADITASDPDPQRLALAEPQAAALAGTSTVRLTTSPVSELDGPFDLVVCSHVIQHIPTADAPRLLARLAELTAPGGRLLISYSRAAVGRESFTVDAVEDGEVRSKPLSRKEFDDLVTAGTTTRLPVHHRDPNVLAAQAQALGWREDWRWVHHVIDDLGVLDTHVDRDVLVNDWAPLRDTVGRDVMALWVRT